MKAAIIGGGISGLTLGWNLKQRGIDFALFEKGVRTGGWIKSCQTEGFLFEKGPHSCRTRGVGRTTLELIEQLGLENEVIGASPAAKRRYFYSRGEFKQVPVCPISLLLSPWRSGVLKALWNDWRTPQGSGDDESIHQFVSRRLSPQLADQLFDPFVTGIFAGDIRQLSVQACFPLMSSWEKEHGGLLKGLWARRKQKPKQRGSPFIQKMLKTSIFSFRNGMQTLTDTLESKLKSHIQLNKEAIKLEKRGERWEIYFRDGTSHVADQIYMTLPASKAALLLPECPDLARIPYASLAIVSFGYKRSVLKKEGFGYLIPSSEKENVMGVLWDSSVFPEQNHHPEETRLTVMLRPGDDPLKRAQQALTRHLDIHAEPDASSLYFADQAIPQYTVGHLEKLKRIEQQLPPSITLLGSSYRTLSVNECIAEALAV